MSKFDKIVIIILFFLFFLSSYSFAHDNIYINKINSTDYSFNIINSSISNIILKYKYDYEYSYHSCNLIESFNNNYFCNISFILNNSNFVYYKFIIGNISFPKTYNKLYLGRDSDIYSKNIFLNISKNSSTENSFKCSYLENDFTCQDDDKFAYAILNLIHLYKLEKNSTYLDYIHNFINTGVSAGSCDFKNSDFTCSKSASSINSGAYKQGLMADMFLQLYHLTNNHTYLNYSYNYLTSNSGLCNPYNLDFTCEDNSNNIYADDYFNYINAYLNYYYTTGDNNMLLIAKNISNYAINHSYFDDSNFLASLVNLYKFTNNQTYFDIAENHSSDFNSICITNNCSLNDYSNTINLYSNLKFYSNDYLKSNFYSQNIIFKLYSGFNNSCNYKNSSFKCDSVLDQGLLSNALYNIYTSTDNTNKVKFSFPRQLNKRANMLHNFNYSIILNGYVSNLVLNSSNGPINTNFLPINKSNYLISNLYFNAEKSEDLNYIYTINNINYTYPKYGSLKVVIGSNFTPELNYFKLVANNSLRDPTYFCDPFGSNPNKADFSCKYEQFQSGLIYGFSSINLVSNNSNFFYKHFLPKISVYSGNNYYYSTCDPQRGDFFCNQYNLEYSPAIQTFAKPGSIREYDMTDSIYSSIQSTNDFQINLSYSLLNSYINSNSHDCNIDENNYSCISLKAQGKKLGFLLDKYFITGKSKDYNNIVSFTDYSINHNLTNTTDFIINLFKTYDLTYNQTYLDLAINLTDGFRNYCIINTCNSKTKYNMINMYLTALKSTNNNLYGNALSDELISNSNSNKCNTIDYYFKYKTTQSIPSSSLLKCDFPDEIGLNSHLFSTLYKEYYNPTKRLFKLNLTSSLNSTNYSKTFNVSCSVENYQNSTIYQQKVRLITPYKIENYSVDSALTPHLINPSDMSVIEVDLANNSKYQFNWTIKANIGGNNSVICNVGSNSSYKYVVSDNIGRVSNISIQRLKTDVVINNFDNLYKIKVVNIPFLLENLTFKLNPTNLNISNIIVKDIDSNILSSNYLPSSNILYLKNDVIPGDEINIYLNASIPNPGFSNISVNMTTNYHGYNNVSSNSIHAINSNLINALVSIISPSSITPGDPYTVRVNILNNISFNNFNYSFDDLKVSLFLSYTNYLFYINNPVFSSGKIGIFNLNSSNSIIYNPNLNYNESSLINWQVNTTNEYYSNAYVYIILKSSNGFYKIINSSRIPFEHTTGSSSSSSGSGSSSGGGGGSSSSVSSNNINSNSNEAKIIPVIIPNSSNVINTFNKTQSNKSDSCVLDLTYNFNSNDIKNSFKNNQKSVNLILNSSYNKLRLLNYNQGLSILKKSNIPTYNYDNYFNNNINSLFNFEKFYFSSINYSIENIECLKVHSNIDKNKISYIIYNFCNAVPELYLDMSRNYNVTLFRTDLDFNKSNYILNLINKDKNKNFISTRILSNKIGKTCLKKSDINSFVLINYPYLNNIFSKAVLKTLNKISEEEKINIDFSSLNNTNLFATNPNNIGNDLIANKIITSSLSSKKDNNSISKSFIILGSILLLIISGFSFIILFYYKFVKLEENMFYLLNLIKHNIKSNNINEAIINLNKFYNKFNYYYQKKSLYIHFIPNIEIYFNLYMDLNNLVINRSKK